MSDQQMSNEIKYRMALSMLKSMLSQGLITMEEFCEVDNLNQHLYMPELAEVYMQKHLI